MNNFNHIPSNTWDMDNALAPRDENGLISPMAFQGGTDGCGKPLHYAVVPNDGSPMYFNDDFLPGGKFYGKITYHPGFVERSFGVMDDGKVTPLMPGEVIFTDPRFNAAQLASMVQRDGIPPELKPAFMQLSTLFASNGIHPVPEEKEISDGVVGKGRKGAAAKLCNSSIEVLSLRRVLDGEKSRFEVELLLLANQATVCVPEDRLSDLASFISARHPWFHLCTDVPNAAAQLEEYVRDQLPDALKVTVIRKPGWTELDGEHFYAHDGATVNPSSHILLETGRKIPSIAGCSAAESFKDALAIIDIGSPFVTLPLLLTAYGGPLAALFEEAGCPLRFCAYLVGVSGSLKTAVSEVFAGFFGERDHSTFRDTMAAIDVNISAHRDRMLLLDDFQPPVVSADGQAMRKTNEHVTRLFGDDIAKKRANGTATETHGERPRGTCLITGEMFSGSYSSMLRCLMIQIDRNSIVGELLRPYQENPALWTGNFVAFLQYVGHSWDNICQLIRDRFPAMRSFFSIYVSERRLADVGAVLAIIAEIFLNYGQYCGALTADERDDLLQEFRDYLSAPLLDTEKFSRAVSIPELCCEALNEAPEKNTLMLAKYANLFQPGFDGFYTEDRLWLRQDSLLRVLRQQSIERQASCVITSKLALPQLYKSGLIIRDEEDGKDGSYLKRTPYIPALGKRTRMVCFDLAALQKKS